MDGTDRQIRMSTEVNILDDPLLTALLLGKNDCKLQLVANNAGPGNVRTINVVGSHKPTDSQQPRQLPGKIRHR